MKQLFTTLILGFVIAFISCNTKPSSSTRENGFKPTKDSTIIVDVRTEGEWLNDGHANCSVNYPLDQLESHLSELMNYSHVTFVCRSGGRAGQATQLLQNQGHTGVTNGGSWNNVTCN